jgi:acyl-CoA hydrolase
MYSNKIVIPLTVMLTVDVTEKLNLVQVFCVARLRWLQAFAKNGTKAIICSKQTLTKDVTFVDFRNPISVWHEVNFFYRVDNVSNSVDYTIVHNSVSVKEKNEMVNELKYKQPLLKQDCVDRTAPYYFPEFENEQEYPLILLFIISGIAPHQSEDQSIERVFRTKAGDWVPNYGSVVNLADENMFAFSVEFKEVRNQCWRAYISVFSIDHQEELRQRAKHDTHADEFDKVIVKVAAIRARREICCISQDELTSGDDVVQCKKCLNVARFVPFAMWLGTCRSKLKPFSCPLCQATDIKTFQRGPLKLPPNYWFSFFTKLLY